MTLNFSSRPVFNTNTPEENLLLSSVKIGNGYYMDEVSEKNWEGSYGRAQQHFNWEFGNSFDSGREHQIGTDIIDLLPVDPFDMNEISATFTAITDWFEDNFIWNGGLKLQSNPSVRFDERVEGKGSWVEEEELYDLGFVSVSDMEEFLSLGNEDTRFVCNRNGESGGNAGSSSSSNGGDGGSPHEGLLFALSYLNMRELLSAERVCRSLCSAVQSDSLLWRNIHIDKPLNKRITDDALLRLTNRAEGKLQSLSLVDCYKITDDGLKRVLESNPKLTKLNVPGCNRLTVEGIVNNLKAFKPTSTPGMKQLRIGSRNDLTHMHFEELKFLVGADKCIHIKAHKPQFYHGHNSLSYDDDRAIDIEICPRCQKLRLVYDCPAESCQGKQAESQSCRACRICITRCFQCGRCINDSKFVETFCLEFFCWDCWKQSDCWKQLIDCQEEYDGNSRSPKHAFVYMAGDLYQQTLTSDFG